MSERQGFNFTDFKFFFPLEGSFISLERLNINSKISPEENDLIT